MWIKRLEDEFQRFVASISAQEMTTNRKVIQGVQELRFLIRRLKRGSLPEKRKKSAKTAV
jgi:hypothetical protein